MASESYKPSSPSKLPSEPVYHLGLHGHFNLLNLNFNFFKPLLRRRRPLANTLLYQHYHKKVIDFFLGIRIQFFTRPITSWLKDLILQPSLHWVWSCD